MSTNDYLPTKDANLAVWLKNYVDACTELQDELGLSPARLQELQDEVTQYEIALDQYTTQIFAARGATATKNLKREQIVRRVRAYTREFKAKPDLSPGDLGLLGVVKTQTGQPLQMVTNLIIVPSAEGTNLIRWDRNGNSQTTNFIIECSAGGPTDYRVVASTTKTRFKHVNQIPGRPLWYRVLATRAGKTTPPCSAVSVYVLPSSESERDAA